ncbi:MAG: hypothetical protein KAX20_00775, partial [Candidatus Omnitrophica bacterium]|nr:hypothetical protein [Candidatus Omnitrophota bacterium]
MVKRRGKNFILLATVALSFLSLRIVDSYLHRRLYPKRPSPIQKNWDVKIYRSTVSRIRKRVEKKEKKISFKAMAPLISCVYVKHPPKIDGKLDDFCWETSQVAENFISPRTFRLAKSKTAVYCLYDKRNIYFGFSCEEPYPNKIRAKMKRPDSQLSEDDSIEIALAPLSEKKELSYCRFAFNSKDAKYEAKKVPKEDNPTFDKKWQADWEVVCQIDRESWNAELSIPFKSLGIKRIEEEESWRINFIRHRYPEGYEKSLWFPVAEKEPSPDSLGSLIFRKKVLLAKLLAAECSDLSSVGRVMVELNNPSRCTEEFVLKVASFTLSGSKVKERKYSIELKGKEEKRVTLYYELTPPLRRAKLHNVVVTLLNDEEKIVYRALVPVIFSPVNPILCCNKVSEPPIIDGNLNDSCWRLSQVASNFSYYEGGRLAKVQTTGYALRDDRNLYLAFISEEPFINEIKCTEKKHDGSVWTDDCIEIFIDSNYDERNYYHFAANTEDVHYEAYRPDIKTRNLKWNSSWQSKTSKGKNKWIMEVSIPLRELRIGSRRRLINLNLNRERYAHHEREYSGWSCTYG